MLGPGHRGDDRRPGPLSTHRPAQGAGLSPVHRAGPRASLTPRRPSGHRPTRPRWSRSPSTSTLKRGVLVRGRVTDKATGRPVSGYVNAYTFADNPHVGEFPGYDESYDSYARLDDDGRYEVVTLPGRGIIACRSDLGRYRQRRRRRGDQGISTPSWPGPAASTRCRASASTANYHVLAEVNLDPKAESATLDLQVDPGRSLTIHVVDPEGRPLGGTKASGLTDLFWTIAYQQDSPTIEIHALDPSKPRRVTITHEGRKLVGSSTSRGTRPAR